MVAMRNLLVHAYDRADLQIVWNTVEQELPLLLVYAESLPSPES